MRKYWFVLISVFVFVVMGGVAFAGQSIQLSTTTAGNNSVPTQTPGNNYRLEFSIHDWAANIHSGPLFSVAPTLVNTQILNLGPGDIRLQFYTATASGGAYSVCQFEIGTLPTKFVTVRYQEDGVNKIDYCQAWDINGNLINNSQSSYTTQIGSNGPGVTVGSTGQNLSIAYFRLYTSIVSTSARPPVSADTLANCLVFWKFDGTLTDSCPAGPYNATMSSGSPVFVPTPGQNLVVPVLKATNSPIWGTGSFRAGFPAQLDGSASYSQSDAGASVSCFWQALSSPLPVVWDNQSSCSPTINGLIFGDYKFQLVVTDVTGARATATQDMGAVATDTNGVVINADPNVDVFFGPMIAFGKNPWGYQDWWANHGSQLRLSDYVNSNPFMIGYPNPFIVGPLNKPQWEYQGQGTISWPMNCNGNTSIVPCGDNSFTGTVAGAPVSVGDSTFVLSNTTGLDLTTFPTHLVLADGGAHAEVRIQSHTGTTMNVAYDGWGQGTAHTFAVGAQVFQSKVQGTGTHFLTDATTAVCPVGAPGPPGPSAYSAGTVNMTAGSNIATASGGAIWTQDKLVGSVSWFRIRATHGGAAFIFSAQNLTGYASAFATVSGGAITAISPGGGFFNGQNYVSGGVNVVITDPAGAGASFTANVVGGAITSYTQMSGGSGYINPTVTIVATKAMLSRPFPASADTAAGLGYDIMLGQRTLVTFSTHPLTGGGTAELIWGNSDCESETELYFDPYGAYSTFNSQGHGIAGTRVSGKPYSVTDSTGWVNGSSTGGISFYGESMAQCALHYRSGLTDPLTACNYIADNWLLSPWGNADGNGFPRLFLGGEGIGSFAARILRNRGPAWDDLRGYAEMGRQMIVDRTGDCNGDDTRDSGYAYAWLILAAIYDSDTTGTGAPGGIPWRTYWQNQLVQMKANDTACQSQVVGGAATNSFANGLYFNAGAPHIAVTNGSAAATGSGIPSSLCQGTASGTATATNGSNLLTALSGIFPTGSDNTAVFLSGTSGGAPFVQNIEYVGSGGAASTITLGAFWKGDSGTVNWMTQDMTGGGPNGSGAFMMTIATSNSDLTNLRKNWACMWNNPSSITLNRPWDGGSGTYAAYVSNLAGFGQQAFMLGIKTYGTNLLAAQKVPALASYTAPYAAFTAQSADWIWNVGMDQQLFTTNYGRVFQQDEPGNTVPPGLSLLWKAPGSTYGALPNQLSPDREQNAETTGAHAIYYRNNPTAPNKILGDEFYGALWGFCPWATGGVYCDQFSTAGNINASQLLDVSIHQGKWLGFFSGIGMTHEWPAARTGGVQPARPRTILVSVRVADVPSTASVNIVVTAPSSAQTTFSCPTEPCAITVDDRQGSHWYQIQYLASGGSILSKSQVDLLPGN